MLSWETLASSPHPWHGCRRASHSDGFLLHFPVLGCFLALTYLFLWNGQKRYFSFLSEEAMQGDRRGHPSHARCRASLHIVWSHIARRSPLSRGQEHSFLRPIHALLLERQGLGGYLIYIWALRPRLFSDSNSW